LTSQIFRNRAILSPRYVPETLVHREDALKLLNSLFGGVASSPSESFLQTVQLVGPLGSGKTSVMQVFGRSLEQEADMASRSSDWKFKHVYINLKEHGGSRITLFRYLLEVVAPGSNSLGISAEEVLTRILGYLRQKKLYVLLSLDEVDVWLKKNEKDGPAVIYDLTRLNENTPDGVCNVVGIIFTARSTGFHDILDDAEKSTLGRIPIYFRPYSEREIEDILSDRVNSAFHSGAVSDELLHFVANTATTPPNSGDARYALELLRYAGNYAEAQGATKVTVEHVRSAISQMYPTITQEDIMRLPGPDYALALIAVVSSLRNSRATYCSFKEIKTEAEILERTRAKNLNGSSISERLDELLQELVDRRIIQMQSFREIGIQGAPLDSLYRLLVSVLDRMESRARN
jgi:cell division control protein 6